VPVVAELEREAQLWFSTLDAHEKDVVFEVWRGDLVRAYQDHHAFRSYLRDQALEEVKRLESWLKGGK